VQYWHQVDISKSEAVSDEKTSGFDGCVQNRDLPMYVWQNRVNHVAIWFAFTTLRSDVLVQVRTDEGTVHNCVNERNPLFR